MVLAGRISVKWLLFFSLSDTLSKHDGVALCDTNLYWSNVIFSAFCPICIWTSPIWGRNGQQKDLKSAVILLREGRQSCQPKGHFMAPQTPICLAFPFSKFTFHPWTRSALPRNNNLSNPYTILWSSIAPLQLSPLKKFKLLTESEDFFSSLWVVSFVSLHVEECEWQIFCGWLLRVGHCRERVWR